MKYLKKFESSLENKFWLIENDNNIKISLSKIGMNEELINKFIDQLKEYYETDKYYYIGYSGITKKWTYGRYKYSMENSVFFINGYNYMGQIRLTSNDIYEYELNHSAKKYNL